MKYHTNTNTQTFWNIIQIQTHKHFELWNKYKCTNILKYETNANTQTPWNMIQIQMIKHVEQTMIQYKLPDEGSYNTDI